MITTREFGRLPNGDTVQAYDFVTEAGFKATVLSYGATLQSLIFPDGTDVVLGFDRLEGYLGEHPYFGGIIGRVANRIGGAGFEIDGIRYDIPANEGPNNLHSGPEGFDRVNWFGEIDGETLILRHTSPDGHQGFPGELQTELRFTFEGSTLALNIQAMTNKPCPVNITYHPYFNLTDGGVTPCHDHSLQINASFYSHTDEQGIATGEISRAPCSVRYRYNDPRPVSCSKVLDTNFHIGLGGIDDGKMLKMAVLVSSTSGHKVIICSTHNCLQAYTGAFIPSQKGKSNIVYDAYHGIALEPQSEPLANNKASLDNILLRPDKLYKRKIKYTFRPGEVRA